MIHIHIGPHKTGSTSIQAFMLAHQEALAAHRVQYPEVGRTRAGGHYGLKAEARDKQSALPGWAALREMDVASPESQFVVSCEGFEYLNEQQITSIAERLHGCKVTVIGYFREYAGLVQSQYLQLSRICRNVDDFDPFFDRYLTDSERVFARFERWATAFGWANVRVRLFDRGSLIGGDVVEDFLHQIGLSRSLLKIEAASERNLAPPWQAVEMMRAVFGEFGRLGGAENEDWLQLMRKQVRLACELSVPASASSKVDYLNSAQRARCNDMTRADWADFNRQLPAPGLPPLRLPDVGERQFMPTVAQVSSIDLAAAMARVTLALLEAGGGSDHARRMTKKAERAAARAGESGDDAPAPAPRDRKRKKVAHSIAQAGRAS